MIDKKNAFLLLSLLVTTTILGGGYLMYQQEITPAVGSEGKIDVRVEFRGLKEDINKSITLENDSSLFEIMLKNFKISYETYTGLGHLITGIEGVYSDTNISNTYWIYYINGQRANRGADFYYPVQGDTVIWRYE